MPAGQGLEADHEGFYTLTVANSRLRWMCSRECGLVIEACDQIHACLNFRLRTSSLALLLFLQASQYAFGIVIYPYPLLSSNFWSELYHIVSNRRGAAGSRASSSCCHSHLLVGIAEEDRSDLCRTDQRSGRVHSAGCTCERHSPWPGGEHARGRKRSCLVSTLATLFAHLVEDGTLPLVSASLSTSPPTKPMRSSLAKACSTVLPVAL